MQSSDYLAFASFATSLTALLIAIAAILRSDVNASGSLLLTFHESFRSSWTRAVYADEESRRDFEIADLLNLLEIACTVLSDGGIHGKARALLDDYVQDCLSIILNNSLLSNQIGKLITTQSTFEHIFAFTQEHRNLDKRMRILMENDQASRDVSKS